MEAQVKLPKFLRALRLVWKLGYLAGSHAELQRFVNAAIEGRRKHLAKYGLQL